MPRTKRKRGDDSTSRRRRNAEAGPEPPLMNEGGPEAAGVENQQQQQDDETTTTITTTNASTEATAALVSLNARALATTTDTIRKDPFESSGVFTKRQKSGEPPQPTSADAVSSMGTITETPNTETERILPRVSRIREALEHRRLLLKRVRQTKTAAQQQVDQHPHRDLTAPQEIASFLEMCRSATSQAARKGDVSKASGRPSVSLRRGASVGKRMNAALSSLAGGGHTAGGSFNKQLVVATADATIPTQQQPATVTSITGGAAVPITSSTTIMPPPISAATMSTSTNLTSAISIKLSKQQPRPTSATAGRGSGSAMRSNSNKLQHSGRGPSIQQQSQQQSFQQQQRSTAGNGISIPAQTRQPQHPQRYLAPPAPPPSPRVICPETTALRERRNDLRVQLAKLKQERQSRLDHSSSSRSSREASVQRRGSTMSERRGSAMSVATTDTSTTAPSLSRYPAAPGTPRSPATVVQQQQQQHPSLLSRPTTTLSSSGTHHGNRPTWRGPDPPPILPVRRKTHWDTLLEEMQWMATDFIEERKWKHAASKFLGKLATASVMQQQQQKQQKRRTSDSVTEGGSICISDQAMEAKEEAPAPAPAASVSVSPVPFHDEVIAPMKNGEADVAEADETAPRNVAQTLSQRVTALVMSSTYPPEDIAGEKACAFIDLTADGDELWSSWKQRSDENQNGVSPDGGQSSNLPPADNKNAAYERASKFVQDILDALDTCSSEEDASSFDQMAACAPMKLLPSQSKVVRTVEARWQPVGVGTILRGTVAAGKTVTTATLLWRHREAGPQLLICSSASRIRWLHELSHFPDLNLKALDYSCVLTDGFERNKSSSASALSTESESAAYGSHDIVLCHHWTITQCNHEKGRLMLGKFRSIVIDCRHPTGFAGSTCAFTAADCNDARDRSAPVELSSISWWAQLVEVAADSSDTRRLLIDSPSIDGTLHFLRGLSKRDFLSIMALRVGFLSGTAGFASPIYYSTEKAILAWARRKIKGDRKETGSKFRRISELLSTLAESFCCYIEPLTKLEEIDISESDFVSWEVLPCVMGISQRTAYDAVCNDVRSALSRSLCAISDDSEPLAAIAAALLRVRRQCFHADLDGALSLAKIEDFFASSSISSAMVANCSQPSAELASRILEGSSKLQQLVSILFRDCGHEIVGADVLDSFFMHDSSRNAPKKNAASSPKKVAILASLPEIQILISVLLSAVGIDHELLLRQSSTTPDIAKDSRAGAAAWTHFQTVLSRFNGFDSDSRSDVSIVIASPLSIGSDHCGLGVEKADTILCLDEDWSGRGGLLSRSLTARCSRHREASAKNCCRIVRLVAKNSCEELFLNIETDHIVERTEENGNSKEWHWSLNEFGIFINPTSVTKRKREEFRHVSSRNKFSFPGCNLFARRGQALDDLFCFAYPRPRLFSQILASELKFLPSLSNEDDFAVENALLKTLLKEEQVSSTWKFVMSRKFHSQQLVPILPPFAPDWPAHFVDSADLSSTGASFSFERILDDGIAGAANAAGLPLLGAGGTNGGISASATPALIGHAFALKERDPIESATSILFYRSKRKRDHSAVVTAKSSAFPVRANFYAALFSSSEMAHDFHDGNQGSEALIYFPPIFPRMQECSALAKADVESLRTRALDTPIDPLGEYIDEKQQAVEPLAKRPRHDPARVITEDEASHSDAASVLLDLSDDYGLAGMGAVPLPRDSALTAAQSTICASGMSTVSASHAQNELLAANPLCDSEEYQAASMTNPADAGSESMILIVSRKRPRIFTGMAGSSLLGRGLTSGTSPWNGVAQTFFQDLNGPKGAKNSAFNLIPPPGSAQARSAAQQVHRSADMYRYRLLNNLRQSGIGSTIFEAPIFRVAAVRVRNKVSDRIVRLGWTSSTAFEAGPGLPLLISKPHTPSSPQYRGMFDVDPNLWTSIVKRLKNKNSVTGAEAIELSIAQRSALRRSLAAPCRVDFGPFRCGFISSPSGMTAVSPPRPRVGVSLPMGVKITHSEKDQSLQQWSPIDDKKLQNSAVRFGMNWIVASRVLSGCQDLVFVSQSESKTLLPQRAARSCRDRWQRLARSDPSVIAEVRQSSRFKASADHIPDGGNPGKRIQLVTESDHVARVDDVAHHNSPMKAENLKKELLELLLPPPDSTPDYRDPEELSKRRTFGALKLAKSKRKAPPAVPGIESGSMPVVAPSHPSHDLSIQEAIAVSRPNGGSTDMWPLQLLDIADRQRAAAAAAAARASSEALLGRRDISTSSRATVPTSNRTTSVGSPSQKIHRTSSAVPHPQSGPVVQHMPMPARASMALPMRSKSNAAGMSMSATAKQSFVPPPVSLVAKQNLASPSSSTPDSATTAKQLVAPAAAAAGAPTKEPSDRGRPG